MLANSSDDYGWLSIGLHWLMAAIIAALFALGVMMVELDYYDPWYNRAPLLHESVGLLLAALLLLRLAARLLNPPPPPLATLIPFERKLATTTHWLFYALMLGTVVSGYLIASAGGRQLALFDWISVPGFDTGIEQQEDIAGRWHLWLSWSLILLAALHSVAAFKHHFVDRDRTLRRILSPPPRSKP